MQSGMTLRVEYWAARNGSTGIDELEGVSDFQNDLADEYVDVSRRLLIDERFLTRKEYWSIWEERWRKEREGRK
jgi:hypothetical protein